MLHAVLALVPRRYLPPCGDHQCADRPPLSVAVGNRRGSRFDLACDQKSPIQFQSDYRQFGQD
ncbi:Uncharacterised protein [Vibrio cholerae]|nr:Uncharacterised protein [Vibrio cholerae]